MRMNKKKLRWLTPKQIKNALIQMKNTGFSMRRRFIIYLLSLFCAFFALALLLLSLLGVLNPADAQLRQALNNHLKNTAVSIQYDMDDLAAYAVAFSDQMAEVIERELAAHGRSFDSLQNDVEALTSLQESAYQTVYTNLQMAPCSGAFYVLNTTCNDSLGTNSRNGLYMKFANLYSENTIHNKVCLYRGFASVAREHNINLHSTWRLEMGAEMISEIDAVLNAPKDEVARTYSVTALYPLSDSWENVRFVCVPISGTDGQAIGVCGFEISSLYFQLSHRVVDYDYPYIFCGLFDETESGYIGQFSGNQSGFIPSVAGALTSEDGKHYVTFRNDSVSFLGQKQEINLGSETHTVAAMIPQEQYDEIMKDARLKIIVFLFIVTIAAFAACLWLSKRYVAPILDGLEKIKSDHRADEQSSIPEIDDLFVFLAEKDREHEEALNTLVQEKQVAQSEKDRLLKEYEQAQSKYETAQTEISRLAYARKREIDPDDYSHFLDGLHRLTPAEQRIFDLYLAGKSAKEILDVLQIKENTLKFHNKSIYSKLGVSSRKQLLQYATLMKQQAGEGSNIN